MPRHRNLLLGLTIAPIVLLFRELLVPGRILAVRDAPFFHLPLRSAFRRLVLEEGIPWWNPWIGGGQPVLSNPNYAAFYPPTWLLLPLPPELGLQILLLGHVALAAVGAWRFAGDLGCDPMGRALATLAFCGGGAFVSSTNTVTLFCGLAWMPWAFQAARGLARATRWRAAIRLAAILALQLLAGEPVTVIATAIAATAIGLTDSAPDGRPRRERIVALAAAALLATGLAAVQLVPTAARILETGRGSGIAAEEAMTWSTHPNRLLDLAFPRLHGDPMALEQNLYFGWSVNDQGFPYVIAIYPGLLALLLALSGWLRGGWPGRVTWLAIASAGIFLALGRHNPAYAGGIAQIPPFAWIRYPEKFLVLTTTAIAFSSGLVWTRWAASEGKKRREAGDLPVALAAIVAGLGVAMSAVLAARPDLAGWWVRTRSLVPPSQELVERLTGVVQRDALLGTAVALGTLAILVLARRSRFATRSVGTLLCAVLAGDLWIYGRNLLPTVSANEFLRPPPVVSAMADAGPGRVFSDSGFVPSPPVLPKFDREGGSQLWSDWRRLVPPSGLLWGLSYGPGVDYDLMATRWGRRALDELVPAWGSPPRVQRLLGDWGVRHLVLTRPARELAMEPRGELPRTERLVKNPAARPMYRFRADFVSEPPPRTDSVRESGSRVEARVTTHHTVEWIAARTYDPGWRAWVDGEPTEIRPDSAGRMVLAVPAGSTHIELRYRERMVLLGLLGTLASLVAIAAVARSRTILR